MFVRYENFNYSSGCQVLSNVKMECRTPLVSIGNRQIDPDNPLDLEYGFLLNNVTTVSTEFSKFFLYPDPIYDKFDERVKYHNTGENLTINGTNLNLACRVNRTISPSL